MWAAALALAFQLVNPLGRGLELPFGLVDAARRESAQIHLTPIDGVGISVDAVIAYEPKGQRDLVSLDRARATALHAETKGGRPLPAKILEDGSILIELAGDPRPSEVHLQFTIPLPSKAQYGLTYARSELAHRVIGISAARVTTSVDVPPGVSLPGFACAAGIDRDTCSRTMRGGTGDVPLLYRSHSAELGLGLLAATALAAIGGVWRAHLRRAAELAEEARAVPPSPTEGPAGAYRRPPMRALSGQVDPEVLRLLGARTRFLGALGVLSTAIVAALSLGRSPWPVPLLVAAWVALAGLTIGLLVERA